MGISSCDEVAFGEGDHKGNSCFAEECFSKNLHRAVVHTMAVMYRITSLNVG